MRMSDYWKIIRERKKLVIMVLAATMLTTLITSMLWPAKYEGQATIMLDYDSGNPMNLTAAAAAPLQATSIEYINTQTEIIQSRRIADGVIDLLKLDKMPDTIDAFNESRSREAYFFWRTPTKPDIKQWLYNEFLSKYLKVEAGRDSRFLYIKFYAGDPAFSAALANAYAKAYTDYNLELKVSPFKEAGKWFSEKLKDAKGYSDRSTEQLREYQQKKGIIAQPGLPGQQAAIYDDAVQRLEQINRELATAKTRFYETQVTLKRVEASRGNYDSLPEILSNSFIQSLKAEKLKIDTELTELSAKAGPGLPQYQRLQSMQEKVNGRLKAEMSTIVSSLRQDYAAASQRVGALESAVAGLKKQSSAASVARFEMDSLSQESETYKQVYEAILKKYKESALQGDINRTNVFLVDMAVPPLKQYTPKIFINLALSLFLGFFLGAGCAIYRDSQDDTIKDAETIEQMFGITVLGTIVASGEI
jgi:polysaccharide biosynthesis transport protein